MLELAALPLTMFAIGLSTRASLRLMYGARGPAPGDDLYRLASSAGSTLATIGVLAGTAMLLFGAAPALVILAVNATELVVARRELARASAWGVVIQAVRRGTPLERAASAQADRFGGIVGRAFRRFAGDLRAGADPADAIARRRRAFPRVAQGYAALAKQGGPLAVVADESVHDTSLASGTRHVAALMHAAALGLIMLGVLTFVLLKIVPEFSKIFDEFEIELPQITRSLVGLGDFVIATPIGTVIGAAMLLAVPVILIICLCYALDLHVLSPLSDRWFYAQRRGQALRLLAVAVEHRLPLDVALQRLSSDPPCLASAVVRRRLARAAALVRSGDPWTSALFHAGLISDSEAPLLDATQRAGNLPWGLRMIAQRRETASSFRSDLIQQIGLPLVIIAIGMFMAFYACALFVPLVKLIEGLT
ncbi:Putative type II secretion system protein F [Pirellulimonas nuda]|uniref:Type II secretion system protein F n=1 Tax=Pirellulimonas nuda TaxID=2528009 RepID=A0A518DI08_9BACT|nr:type II secretion system F family protein [Pirellulimonas nuda]QDU91105.1 Putative type II secretion system protein F [Pirellulimonas nuda]